MLCAIGVYFVLNNKLTKYETERDAQIEEGFNPAITVEDQVIRMYNTVLLRDPNSKELSTHSTNLSKAVYNLDGLRMRLVNTDEYDQIIKMQSNDLTPELQKMIYQSRLVTEISQIYLEEKGRPIPPFMVIPLLDIYKYIDYNPYVLRAILRSGKWDAFEKSIETNPEMTKEELMKLFSTSFNMAEMQSIAADLAAKDPNAAKLKAGEGEATSGLSVTQKPTCTVYYINGSNSASSMPARTIQDTDGNMEQLLQQIQQNSKAVFDKDAAAQMLDPTHQGNMVLRPEYAWSVPQKRAPVCTSIGQAQTAAPLNTKSDLLLGTPLEEASNTQVGSIMPKFVYQQYVQNPSAPVVSSIAQ